VVDENDNQRARPAAARKVARSTDGSTGASRDGATDASVVPDAGAEDATPTRRPRRSTPFWRKGRFWVAVIVLEVALALVISFSFERSPTDVDISGGDLVAFCAQVRTLQSQRAAAAAEGDSTAVTDPSRFEEEREAYLGLIPVAPPDLVPDLERLAELDDQVIATVNEIAVRKAADPLHNGLADLTEALDRAGAEGRVAAARFDVVLADGCGIVPGAEPAPSTVAPVGPVPGTAPR